MEEHTSINPGVEQLFPVADRGDLKGNLNNYRAKYVGEFRVPLAGEWYLSGAIVEAYFAQHKMISPYHIAVIVPGKHETIWRPLRPGETVD